MDIAQLIEAAPALGSQDRAEWNRKLDQAMATAAGRMVTAAGLSRAAALDAGDNASAARAEKILAGAVQLQRWAKEE